jgi:hypothetical protein
LLPTFLLQNEASPLHVASQNGNIEVIALLVAKKADVHSTDKVNIL